MSIQHLSEVLSNPEMKASLERRFASKVKVSGPNDCWPWISRSVAKYGYGRMTAGRGRYLRAHQVAWALIHGPIPKGQVIRHTCDNPSCCNPSHLVAGQQVENVQDSIVRGRSSAPPLHRGESHPMAKLTLEQSREIRNCGGTLNDTAGKYGVSAKTVWRIRNNKQWKETCKQVKGGSSRS